MTEKRKTVTVYLDDLLFLLKEWRELRDDFDRFTRRRFSVSASVTRLEGMAGVLSDPDKTPVRPTFISRRETEPGGIRVPPYNPTRKGNGNTDDNS